MIVCRPAPGIAKLIRSAPAVPLAHSPAGGAGTGFVFAEMIASRRLQAPSFPTASSTFVTVIVAPESEAYPENRRSIERTIDRAVFPTGHLRNTRGIG